MQPRSRPDRIAGVMAEELLSHYVSPFSFGLVHLGLRRIDEAMIDFEKAFVERSSRLSNILVDRRFREIRHDARFAALEQRHGLAFPQPAVSSR